MTLSKKANTANIANKTKGKGFTLLELIIVIIILGIMSVGIAGFITLSTQTYLNVSERDELLANARFVIERLNREIRNAVPNSIRVKNSSSMQCIEFVPIEASTTYIDIPVAPEAARNTITVIPFNNKNDTPYKCDECSDQVIVYPLSASEVYDSFNDSTGKVFNLGNFSSSALNEWTLPIASENGVVFDDDSPTERLYIANQQVTYCVLFESIYRFKNGIGGSQSLPPRSRPYLMAEYVAPININDLPFTIMPATLARNAMVQVNLHFIRNDEDYVFNNDIHIHNVP